jgi:phosphatidylglycerol:prolipoprotein diacylglycerol transferase
MLPYYEAPTFHLGPIPFEPFGLFVAAGVLLAAQIIVKQAQKRHLDPRPLADVVIWALAGGIVGGHFVHLFLYHPEELHKGPLQVLRMWDGLSSFGGLLGGLLAMLAYFRWKGVRFSTYADALALGVAPGWAVARIGCFAVHDHPGVRSDFFLAVNYPGGARHDLGLYDSLVLFAITGLLFLLARVKWFEGRLMGVLALIYGTARFFFDFLRATDLSYVDRRYAGLTPAQYGCILIVSYGVWQLVRRREPSQTSDLAEAA